MEGQEVEVTVDGQNWSQVRSLEGAGPNDRVYVLNPRSGAITFGDGRQGRRPPGGANVTAAYRTGTAKAGCMVSVSWSVNDAQALSASVLIEPGQVRFGLHKAAAHSWRWRFAARICNFLKSRLLRSLSA